MKSLYIAGEWLAGQGEAGLRGAPSGDLYVTVHVRPDKVFGRDGDDLKRTTAAGTAAVATVQPAKPIAYATLPDGNVAWSDGATIGQVGAFGPSAGLCLPSPGAPPANQT